LNLKISAIYQAHIISVISITSSIHVAHDGGHVHDDNELEKPRAHVYVRDDHSHDRNVWVDEHGMSRLSAF